MYYAEYNDYVTQRYTTIQEAVNDMVQYMIAKILQMNLRYIVPYT